MTIIHLTGPWWRWLIWWWRLGGAISSNHTLRYIGTHPHTITPSHHHTLTPTHQHIFVTEVDGSKTNAVHDDLARLMVLHFRQGFTKSEKLLQVQYVYVLGISVCDC